MTEPDDQRRALEEHLVARGVPAGLVAGEADLNGLAADVNVRGPERISLREAAERAGLDPAEARRVWLTAGVAVGDDDDPAFTPDEVAVLTFYAASAELFGPSAVLQVLRVAGSAAMRVAEAETAVLRINFEVPYLDAGGTDLDLVDGYERLSRMLLPEMDRVFANLHRLHLARSARRAWAVDADSTATLATVAVGFADLADFTALAGRLSPTELAGVVEAFDHQAGHLVVANGGQVVKLIGDEVMFVADRPADGLRIAAELARALGDDDGLPGVRVGVAAGEVLNRDGDYYGSVVNLAARLVARARPGQVLVDDALAVVAGADRVEALPTEAVKGFAEPVRAHRLLP